MISNVGGSPLKLGKFEVAAMNPQTSVSEFALMTGGYNDAEGIEPGGSLEIEVRFTPSSKGFKFVELRIPSNDLSAPETAIAIRASSESKDLLQFPVSANSNPPCLRITPDDHNFGTVQGQCSSAARTFAISNTCSSAVTVKSVETIFPAGEPAGSAHCPGTLACPEFVVVDSSEVAPGTVISAGSTPRILKLQYRPLNVGPDVGAIELRVRQFGETVDALITLSGTGDAPPGTTADTFKGPRTPPVYFLTSNPAGGLVKVKIDSVLLEPIAGNGTVVWTYDAAANSIHFAPLFTPAPESTIVFDYDIACRP